MPFLVSETYKILKADLRKTVNTHFYVFVISIFRDFINVSDGFWNILLVSAFPVSELFRENVLRASGCSSVSSREQTLLHYWPTQSAFPLQNHCQTPVKNGFLSFTAHLVMWQKISCSCQTAHCHSLNVTSQTATTNATQTHTSRNAERVNTEP